MAPIISIELCRLLTCLEEGLYHNCTTESPLCLLHCCESSTGGGLGLSDQGLGCMTRLCFGLCKLFFRDLVTVVGLGVEGTTRGRAPNLLRSLAEKRFLPLGYYGRMIYSSCIHITLCMYIDICIYVPMMMYVRSRKTKLAYLTLQKKSSSSFRSKFLQETKFLCSS